MRWMMLGLFALIPFLSGCGSGAVKVSGQVRYDGKPLPGGRLTFQPADPKKNSVPAEIDEQGHYEVTLPVGEVKVAVDNRELVPAARAGGSLDELPPNVMNTIAKETKKKAAPAPPPAKSGAEEIPQEKKRGKYVAIPEKYYTIEDSGLGFTVDSKNPTHDIELKK